MAETTEPRGWRMMCARVPPDLLYRARVRAAQRGETLKVLVRRAVERELSTEQE